ncbi:hypothetical protein ACIOD2_16650 [Amycolatopsis sp. NPDC088138]|uniref:hypothetical protein n=1 Tax=Amycolatopsis sp. NPDC088138 TaxID=3363938 RepID=UPI00381F2B3E
MRDGVTEGGLGAGRGVLDGAEADVAGAEDVEDAEAVTDGSGTDEDTAAGAAEPPSCPHAASTKKGTINKAARVLRRIFPPRQQWQNEAEP